MSLPIRTKIEDVVDLCGYLASKPTGATKKEAKAVLDSKRLDGRKLNALRLWGLMEDVDDRMKVTEAGRELLKSDEDRIRVLTKVIRGIPPYAAIIERAAHRHEDTLTTTDVAAHWHDHFKDQVGESDRTLNDQAVCFFQIAASAGMGTIIVGRRGQPTRFSFLAESLNRFIQGLEAKTEVATTTQEFETDARDPESEKEGVIQKEDETERVTRKLGQSIFIAHGKNKKPLEQLKKILDQFRIPYKVAIDEPNLGRPISGKVREIMKACNCAVLIFTADEELRDKDGKAIWRPSENVVYELGATGYLYDNRIVIMKEDKVDFPSNFQDIGYIAFKEDQLEAKAIDILKELIGFGIVRVSL